LGLCPHPLEACFEFVAVAHEWRAGAPR
jgi:hypothetical protein